VLISFSSLLPFSLPFAYYFTLPLRAECGFSVTSLTDEDMEDKTYWFHKSPKERLIALEYLRQVMYSYDPDTTRLQRVFEIAQLPSR